MASIYIILGVVVSLTAILAIFALLLSVFIQRKYLAKHYLKGIMRTKTSEKGFVIIWLKKTGKEESKYKIIRSKSYGDFLYEYKDVFKLGFYDALLLDENNTHALSMSFDSKKGLFVGINPLTMRDFVKTKLLDELLKPSPLKDALLILGLAFILIGFAVIYYKVTTLSDSLDTLTLAMQNIESALTASDVIIRR